MQKVSIKTNNVLKVAAPHELNFPHDVLRVVLVKHHLLDGDNLSGSSMNGLVHCSVRPAMELEEGSKEVKK